MLQVFCEELSFPLRFSETSGRPYKRAWTHAEAAAHLQEISGAHFDPRVVTTLLRLLEEAPDATA